MLTGRRYLLALTGEQAVYAEQVGAVCRAVWNTALEQRRAYRRRGGFIGYDEQARQMAEAKKDPDCAWLADVPSHTLQQTLRDMERACKTHGTWKVRWRSKTRTAPSFRFPDPKQIGVRRLNRRWGEVRLPRFGSVRFRWTRPLGGTIRNATVSRDGGRWYISFCVEDGVAEAAPNGKPPVGVDRGVAVAVATSDGDLDDRAFVTPGEAARLKRLQQRLSRSLRVHGRNRGSKRRDATRAQLGRLNARIRARRADFAAQTAVRLVREHGMVAVEGLRIKNMTVSAKGTVEQPGRNVKAKAGLNRAILAKGWGGFLLKLEHAARYHGAKIEKVNPAYTSQTCNACKHVAAESRESQAVFRCVACGHQDHADVNAAKNILAAGLAVTGRGDLAEGQSVKRQPTRRLAA
ncbi:transposase [Micromonospora sp. DR5-3]|uniref:RNA-guided endonuclease InsQ/TnpB family protein n=1 Tax=unclassified Micromonospora TaxID=2617518 RepID=UPI0011D8E173|nr:MULTISPECIES: RNA-guided endonuclease TnpB family protein [unclassified Micromonospora]MCW3818244.1 transposase [Micromonospora sp. DR5-3]TYC21689.1 transposase [Micromonospora sp. MP36]